MSVEGGLEAEWEFDAPRFYDFVEGSPEGSSGGNAGPDGWFDTSATKGLASPLEKPKPQQQGTANKAPPQQQPAARGPAIEAKVVRKALAHITNNTKPAPAAGIKQQQPAAPPKRPASAGTAKAVQSGPRAKSEAPKPEQQTRSASKQAAAPAQPREEASQRAEGSGKGDPAQQLASGAAEPAGIGPAELDKQAPKRRRTHGMAMRSMTSDKSAAGSQGAESSRQAQRGAAGQGPSLTMPKSPKLITKKRTRPTRFKPREVVEEEEMAAMPKFKARPLNKHILLDKSGRLGVPTVPTKPPTEPEPFQLATDQRAAEHEPSGSTAAGAAAAAAGGVFVFVAQAEGSNSRVTRGKKKAWAGGITEPKPFSLATDARGEAKQAQQAAAVAQQEEQPKRGKRRRTSGPPQLATDARGERSQVLLEQKRQRAEVELKEQAEFKAMPLNKAALAHPYKPAPSSASLTIPQNVQLASNVRALDRMQFDNAVALKQQLEEEEHATAMEQRRKEEEAEVRKYRRGLQFKAQPLPDFYGRHGELS